MNDKPILFSAPMVRAILAGTKTQTRRIIKCPAHYQIEEKDDGKPWPWMYDSERDRDHFMPCPYGQPGDRLWVRETWMPDAPRNGEWADTSFYGCGMSPLSEIPECYRKPWHCLFRATWDGCELVGWKSSIHMPRWASRITLEVTSVRVERLKAISEADAIAEGITPLPHHPGRWLSGHRPGLNYPSAVSAYRELWESINGPGSWEANPWVWCVSFRRVTP